jgi:hypothetical protein
MALKSVGGMSAGLGVAKILTYACACPSDCVCRCTHFTLVWVLPLHLVGGIC